MDMAEFTLGEAYPYRGISDSSFEKDIRRSSVLSSFPWKYTVDCRNDIKDGQKRCNEIRADAPMIREMILYATPIGNITSVLQDMGDKARAEEDSNEVRAMYSNLEDEIQTPDWSEFSECTFFMRNNNSTSL